MVYNGCRISGLSSDILNRWGFQVLVSAYPIARRVHVKFNVRPSRSAWCHMLKFWLAITNDCVCSQWHITRNSVFHLKCNWWEAAKVMKSNMYSTRTQLPFPFPKYIHLKEKNRKHVLQIHREEKNWFIWPQLSMAHPLLQREMRAEICCSREPLPLYQSTRSTIQLQPGSNEMYKAWSFLMGKPLNITLLFSKTKSLILKQNCPINVRCP